MKPPVPDPAIERFADGMGVLSVGGQPVGHVATHVSEFWSPSRAFRRQWWVWYIVVWSDGTRERSEEDYPPWTAVTEMRSGHLDIMSPNPRAGRYDFVWLEPEEAASERARLGITADDF